MRISGIRITNYCRFRGEHELELGPGVYAVVARDSANDQQSNWRGKSSFLSTISWALFGVTPKAPLDSAISHGENDMGVDLELSDGMFITRTKRRGQSAQLRVVVPDGRGGERELAQDLAQQEIFDRIGFGQKDFDRTMWFRQKLMSKFVTDDPAERTRVVTEWVSLGKVESAAGVISKALGVIETELSSEMARYEIHSGRCGSDRAVLVEESHMATTLLGVVRGEIAAAQTTIDAHRVWESDRDRLIELERSKTNVRYLETAEPRLPNSKPQAFARSKLILLNNGIQSLKADVDRLLKLSNGVFDGQCPVICAECPVASDITTKRAEISEALGAARKRCIAAEFARVRTATRKSKLDAVDRKWNEWKQQLNAAIIRLEALPRPTVTTLGPEPEFPKVPDLESTLQRQLMADSALQRFDEAYLAMKKSVTELERLRDNIGIHRTALAILGAARRQITTRALTSIQSIANAMLEHSGVELGVSLEYGRQLAEIAQVCDCGKAFPRSATVKVCDACGAVRGKKRDDKLYVNLSSVSGAAEDLAGVAIQLAAARWLRGMRQAPWSVVALDEPFGSLDRHNRAALARAIVRLVSDGFEQAFVVAHNDDVLDAMPNRLLITATDKWSKIAVV